jgi:hypothetical protein
MEWHKIAVVLDNITDNIMKTIIHPSRFQDILVGDADGIVI